MIHTGSKTQPKAVAVIPARYSSTRLPGKPLLDIAGKPLVVWVAERARAASSISRTIVATDDPRIADAVSAAGFDAVITRADHLSGTDRIAEVAHNLSADIIVNVQGDEPLIDPETINRAVNALIEDPNAQISTTWEPITEAADVLNPSVVKVTFDENGYATGFSRNPIPFPKQAVEQYGSLEAALGVPMDRDCLVVLGSTPGCTRIVGISSSSSRAGRRRSPRHVNRSSSCARSTTESRSKLWKQHHRQSEWTRRKIWIVCVR